MSRSKKSPFSSWETTKCDGIEERYIRLGNSQMLHPTFIDLSHSAFKVYTYMKLESGGKIEFAFPHSKFIKIISKQGFQSAVSELVESGFIDIAEKNANIRKPNKYRFSERWKSIIKP